jgi:uncharacterized protein (DUF433 family)
MPLASVGSPFCSCYRETTGSISESTGGSLLPRAKELLGGKLAIRGTRLGVSLILECLASGMSLDDLDESFGGTFPRQAMPEVLKVASEITDSFHVAA